jgi:hypothetical protein
VQGQLRNERLTFEIITECGHCQEAIHINIDSELNYRVQDQGAEPMIYMPLVNFDKLDDPSIIDAF